jgi:hypothetical protein
VSVPESANAMAMASVVSLMATSFPETVATKFSSSRQYKELASLGNVDHEISLGRQRAMPKNSNKKWTLRRMGGCSNSKQPVSRVAFGVELGRTTGSIMGRLSVLNTRTARLKRAATSSDQSVP